LTNITRDHLDYHKDFDDYVGAKLRLFSQVLAPEAMAVLNADDPVYALARCISLGHGHPVLSYGRDEAADLRLVTHSFHATGQDVVFNYGGDAHRSSLSLIGSFQVENVMAAAGLAIATGEKPEAVFAALPTLTGVRGRMELAATRENGAAIYVDYAHTPDALSTAIKALRPHCQGRLVVVGGAGGDRDPGKRPMMGKAMADHADVVIVTDDNPRTEDPAAIRAAVRAGCPEADEIGDRAAAILAGIDALKDPGDCLLIAGKGHEQGQDVGTHVIPFDDVEQARAAVTALDGIEVQMGSGR
jgi:UDP-N-acetylmuramoyl-L-alanyl-D-glutamate--2,6-diaminopimelate ligase